MTVAALFHQISAFLEDDMIVIADPGDALFFSGNLLHISPPNRSSRWRRAFIFHYVNGTVAEASLDCHPGYRRNGEKVWFRNCAWRPPEELERAS